MSRGDTLGKNTRFASTRARRYALQAVARKLLPGRRVGLCLRWVTGRPEVWYSPAAERAHYKKLMVCGDLWTCPVCASKITERRRQELDQAIKGWGGSVFLVTFTLQHGREDSIGSLVENLNQAYRGIKSGRAWQEFECKYQLVGSVASLELTVSNAAGWHPHKHVLFFSSLKPGDLDENRIQAWLSERFTSKMQEQGRYVSAVYGVRVEKAVDAQAGGDEALKAYVAKWGLGAELAKGPVKAAAAENGVLHYSPFQLLELAGMGDKQAEAWFVEYAEAMKGRKQLVWSRGLRERLGLATVEKTDIELAGEQVSSGDILLAQLSLLQWRLVLANDARAELLDIADTGDASAVWAFIEALGEKLEAWQLAPP